jgi:hypothetical protein
MQNDKSKGIIIAEDKENNCGEYYDNFIQRQRQAQRARSKGSSEARTSVGNRPDTAAK